MTFTAENPVQTWDLETYDEDKFDDMWRVFNDLPVGSVVATGFLDDGLVYFEREGDEWVVVQVDNPNVEDMLPVGSTTEGDRAVIDGGGDIEVAHVIREGGL
jgi:hypothetical protein